MEGRGRAGVQEGVGEGVYGVWGMVWYERVVLSVWNHFIAMATTRCISNVGMKMRRSGVDECNLFKLTEDISKNNFYWQQTEWKLRKHYLM